MIGDEPTRSSGKDRTALLLQISHKPGSLSDALQAFKKSKINLTWIESFPMRGPEPGYLFFLDFEGHIDDARIKRALEELQPYAVRLSVRGSIPAANRRNEATAGPVQLMPQLRVYRLSLSTSRLSTRDHGFLI